MSAEPLTAAANGAPSAGAPVWQPPPDVPTVDCADCGCKSPLRQYFRRQSGNRFLCPRCMFKRSAFTTWRGVLLLAVFMLVLTLLGSRSAGYLRLSIAANILLSIACIWVILPLHEGIHALAAYLLGGRVYEVSIGGGELRYSTTWRGVILTLRRNPYVGICLAAFPDRHRIRARWFGFVAAPLVVQFLLILWLIPYADPLRYITTIAWVEVFILVNVVIIALNVFPRRINEMVATDGYRMLQVLRGQQRADELHATYFLLDSAYALNVQDYARMQSAAQAGLALYPQNELLKNQYAASFLVSERFTDAAAYFEKLLSDESVAKISATRGMYLCNYAAALFQLALAPGGLDEASLARAHASAEEAFFLLPWPSPVNVVHAHSLILRHREHQAMRILIQVLPEQETHDKQAEIWALIALARHRQGNRKAALDAFDHALRLATKPGYTITSISALIRPDTTQVD